MKILGICGSPRKGNSEKVLSALLSYSASEHTVKQILLSESSIDMCDGCLDCQNTGSCPHYDDMVGIRNEMKNADLILLSTPVYFDDVPGILKNVIDRTNLFSRELKGKKMFIIVCGQADETSWNRAVEIIENYCAIVGIKPIGNFGFYSKNIGDIGEETINTALNTYVSALETASMR